MKTETILLFIYALQLLVQTLAYWPQIKMTVDMLQGWVKKWNERIRPKLAVFCSKCGDHDPGIPPNPDTEQEHKP